MNVAWVALVWSFLVPSLARAAPGDEISRSRGRTDGVVVLWPRVVPATTDPVILALAQRLQRRLGEVAEEAVDPDRVDVRPAPERVCPSRGCKATSIGLLLGHQAGGCAALAIVGPPDGGMMRLVPIAGKFDVPDASLPFRVPPEDKVVVTEFVPCAQLEMSLDVIATARLLRE